MKRFSVRYLVAVLLAGDLLMVALHLLLSSHPHLGTAFDLDMEGNVPTWWASLKFAMAGAAAVFCYYAESVATPPNGRRFSWGWLAVAALMLGMSCDETGQLHEALSNWIMSSQAGGNLRTAFGASKESGAMLWGVVVAPFLLTLAVVVFLFYFSRFKTTPWLLGGYAAAVLLLVFDLVLETRDARLLGTPGFLPESTWGIYRLNILAEETSEMFASTALTAIHVTYAVSTLMRRREVPR